MALNSLAFIGFFAIVFLLYWILQRHTRWQNALLLTASYAFYALCDWRMLPIPIVMTVAFWFLGKKIGELKASGADHKAAKLTTATVVIGLLPLLYFKYFGFFAQSFVSFIGMMGIHCSDVAFNILLPIGISFFTFRLLSYAIELNRGTIAPCNDPIAFGTYIAFFPTLVAGPIDRPQAFLPQLQTPREPSYDTLVNGLKRFVWGCFLKVCVADQLAVFVDNILDDYASQNMLTLVPATLLYPMQLYADFAGYSHMAIGVSAMLGLKVAENFQRPFFAQNVAEYWRRWHMSLTSWLTDYVFLPLNVHWRDWRKWGVISACTINMLLVGFWHGANWTFGLFGLYHALLFVPLILRGTMNKRRKIEWRHGMLPAATLLRMAGTYLLVTLGMLVFRSASVGEVFSIIAKMFTIGPMPQFDGKMALTAGSICMLVIWVNDWLEERDKGQGLLRGNKPLAIVLSLSVLILAVLLLHSSSTEVFIYQKF